MDECYLWVTDKMMKPSHNQTCRLYSKVRAIALTPRHAALGEKQLILYSTHVDCISFGLIKVMRVVRSFTEQKSSQNPIAPSSSMWWEWNAHKCVQLVKASCNSGVSGFSSVLNHHNWRAIELARFFKSCYVKSNHFPLSFTMACTQRIINAPCSTRERKSNKHLSRILISRPRLWDKLTEKVTNARP